jgi:hypothetical protein
MGRALNPQWLQKRNLTQRCKRRNDAERKNKKKKEWTTTEPTENTGRGAIKQGNLWNIKYHPLSVYSVGSVVVTLLFVFFLSASLRLLRLCVEFLF